MSRAILARRLGHARGTQIALRVGQALAFAFGLAGLLGGAPDLTRAMVAYAHALRGALRGPDVTAELERLLTPDLAASRGGRLFLIRPPCKNLCCSVTSRKILPRASLADPGRFASTMQVPFRLAG